MCRQSAYTFSDTFTRYRSYGSVKSDSRARARGSVRSYVRTRALDNTRFNFGKSLRSLCKSNDACEVRACVRAHVLHGSKCKLRKPHFACYLLPGWKAELERTRFVCDLTYWMHAFVALHVVTLSITVFNVNKARFLTVSLSSWELFSHWGMQSRCICEKFNRMK